MKVLLMILFAPFWLGIGLMTGNPMLLASWLLQPKGRSGRQQWQDQRKAGEQKPPGMVNHE
jgi:hypothetical protein